MCVLTNRSTAVVMPIYVLRVAAMKKTAKRSPAALRKLAVAVAGIALAYTILSASCFFPRL